MPPYVRAGGHSGFALAPPRTPRSLRGSLIRLPLRSPPFIPLPAALAAVLACSVSSPATEIREALARAAPIELAAGDTRVSLARATFSDVTVSFDGGRARVLAVVEGDGRVRAPEVEVALAYVGREAFAMERCPSRSWCPAGPALPALAGVVKALRAAPRPPGRRPSAWQIRVERDRAIAGEDAEGPAAAPARAVVELVRDGERWKVRGGS